jgi:hypothetical protein
MACYGMLALAAKFQAETVLREVQEVPNIVVSCAKHVSHMFRICFVSFRSKVRFNRPGNGHQRRTGWRLGGDTQGVATLLRHCSPPAQHQGVVSLRHSHNFRFGQDDIFVSVKVKVP